MAATLESWLLYHVPGGLLILGITAGCIGLALLGQVAVRRSVELSRLEAHQDVAGFILAVVGVVYAVLLAFVVVSVWEGFERARSEVDREATVLLALYQDATALDDIGPDARPLVSNYANLIVDVEWDHIAREHQESPTVDAALNELWAAFRRMEPRSQADIAFFDAAVGSLHELSEVRRARVGSSGNQLHSAMWFVLIVGGGISVAFTYFFGVRNFAAQALMVSALAALVGLVLALILALDLPFTGSVAVEPDRIRDAIAEFAHITE